MYKIQFCHKCYSQYSWIKIWNQTAKVKAENDAIETIIIKFLRWNQFFIYYIFSFEC